MNSSLPSTAVSSSISARYTRLRHTKDTLARYVIGIGGVSVIVAVLLIAFYLFYVVLPLFVPARIHSQGTYPMPGGVGVTSFLTVDEQNEIAVRVKEDGRVVFFRVADGVVTGEQKLTWPTGSTVTSVASAPSGYFALGLSNGSALFFTIEFAVSYPGGAAPPVAGDGTRVHHSITPNLAYPLGEAPLVVDEKGQALQHLALGVEEGNSTLVATTADQRLVGVGFSREENLMGDVQVNRTAFTLPQEGHEGADYLLLSTAQKSLYAIALDGRVVVYDVPPNGAGMAREQRKLTQSGVGVSAAELLLGGVSLLVGGTDGSLAQWFPVRSANNIQQLTHIRDFAPLPGAVQRIIPAHRMKGFIAMDGSGQLGLYHATAHRTLLRKKVMSGVPALVTLSPRGDGAMWQEEGSNNLLVYKVVNEYPEISWSSLWEKVWYEGRSAPAYLWQSSAETNDFEPKMSLVPLTLGTLKAAFFAMLVAVPLGILGAMYTAYFMAPQMRTFVKPTIEIMGAMPTVILGFLAGLWLAPLMEQNLPGIILLLVSLPLAIFLAAWAWSRLPQKIRVRIPEGWEAALLVPVVIGTGVVAFELSEPLEVLLFDGDVRYWLTSHGIPFNQRNSLVVGIAMGFAVAPPIFSIAEDAIFAVPRHLTLGSLALGGTPWQTMMRVVLLTASPGIFSAVMIGLGRAVGETMIMLMATGNTPILNFNIFEGFRALSANIAVEMPEAELNSTHYRVLFLTALVLFLFTFILNTIAEVVRQRLRRRYSSL